MSKKEKALKAMEKFIKKHGIVPTQAWVSRESGASVQWVNDLYESLVQAGYLKKLGRGLFDIVVKK